MSQEGQNPGHLPPQDPSLQQQQQPPSAGQQLQSSAAPTEFQCQWVGCGERAANAEQLYVRLPRRYPWEGLELTVPHRTMSAKFTLVARAPTTLT